MATKYDPELLLDCATMFLSWMSLQDPSFETRIQITRDELHLDDRQVLAMYVAHVLDNGLHMVYREYPFMQPGYSGHLGPRPCSYCGVEFGPVLASDTCCGKSDCLEAHAAALDAAFEKKNGK